MNVTEVSAFAASRNALLGQSSTTATTKKEATPAASVKITGQGWEDDKVWVLCVVGDGELPEWAEKKEPVHLDSLDMSTITEPVYGQSEYGSYIIVKVAIKEIANTLSPPLVPQPAPSHQKSKTQTTVKAKAMNTSFIGGADIPLNELILEFILMISPFTGGDSSSSTSQLFTDFMREYDITQVEFIELQSRLIHQMSEWLEVMNLAKFTQTFQQQSSSPDDYFTPQYYHRSRLYPIVCRIKQLNTKIETMQHMLSEENLSLFPEFQTRKRILQSLGYLDPSKSNDVITIKGLVCCELNACNELLGTEILYHHLLDLLEPAEAMAMLSCLVFQEKNTSGESILLSPTMEIVKQEIISILYQLNTLQILEGITTDEIDTTGNNPENPDEITSINSSKVIVNFGLCFIAYQWCCGLSLQEIMKSCELQEGAIIRSMMRLEELGRDIQNAAKVMRDRPLYEKMVKGCKLIRRDIITAASIE
eukprot:CAMPEP_0173158050 /NCGR_PEP_ID=MMETSP1105-20130129/16054_1 /TAXON_ID=2985 /ORGANISM="Ochromonas sp., Strain BG-1" /LENGTH=477 /DNA_ID=CAMNT_0014075761 /DNA_START=295 /DNA_END=1728 /DNA_ORIENTATION=-